MTGVNDTEIDLREVVVFAGSFPALARASTAVQRGELVALTGANGAGKTTLLNVCAGLATIHSGAATVCGYDVATQASSVRASVGVAASESMMYPDLTVMDNLGFWIQACGADPARIVPALERLDVESRLGDVAVSQLSTGQRRRVELARVVALARPLWLLDEPHSGLDPGGRDLVDELMREAAASGVTVVFSTHEMDRTAAVADRSIEIVNGYVADLSAEAT